MIDIHMHILQGLDDGAIDLEEALTMLARAESNGVTDVIATPHSWAIDDIRTIRERTEELNIGAVQAGLSVKVHEGCEFNVMNGDAIRKTGDRLRDLTLAGSRYLLTEFSNTVSGRSFLDCLERITAIGMIPIVAHPERYALMWDSIDAMREAGSMGALGQISMGDLIGRNGGQSMMASFKMIEEGLCQFCATDAHTPDKLTSYMKAKDEVRRRYGEVAYDRLFRLNPEVVLRDRDASAILGAID